MKITSITQNYSNPYFGSVNYKRGKGVSEAKEESVNMLLNDIAEKQAGFVYPNALLKLLALGFETYKGSEDDYPVDVTITKRGVSVRMPKVEIEETIDESSRYDNAVDENLDLESIFDDLTDEDLELNWNDCADEDGFDDVPSNYQELKVTWDKNGEKKYEIKCDKISSETVRNAFYVVNDQKIGNENEFLSNLLHKLYGV